jgi:transposase
MAIADGHGLPIAVRVTSSSPNESTLVEDTLSQRHVGGLPKRLIADRAYDSDRLDERLRQEHSVGLIVPTRRRRKRTQDGRPLRRYRRRWKVERLFCLAEELPPYLQPLGNAMPPTFSEWFNSDAR